MYYLSTVYQLLTQKHKKLRNNIPQTLALYVRNISKKKSYRQQSYVLKSLYVTNNYIKFTKTINNFCFQDITLYFRINSYLISENILVNIFTRIYNLISFYILFYILSWMYWVVSFNIKHFSTPSIIIFVSYSYLISVDS